MSRRRPLIALAACGVLLAAAPAAPAAAPRNCGYVSFSGAADDNGVTLFALRITCRSARAEVRRWFGPGGRGPRARGWTCRQGAVTGGFAKSRCTKGARRITYLPAG